MYSRAVWALAALMLGSSMPAAGVAVPAHQRDALEPVDRVVAITSSDLIAIRSYYRRRVEDTAAPGLLAQQPDPTEQQLWGFTADSSLPVSAAKAQLEYAVWMPPGSAEDGFADDRNRLIRLRLNDQRRHVAYGANFFAVGETFASTPIARERLDAAGLPGPGEGAELWLSGRLPGIGLEPRFRRLEKSEGETSLLNETFGLAYGHGAGKGRRIQYLLESSASASWLAEASRLTHDRQAAAATLRFNAPDWTVYLKNLRFDEAFTAGREESGSTWEFGGTLRVSDGLTLSPLVIDQIRELDPDRQVHATNAQLVVHTTWLEPLAVDVRLQRHLRTTPDGNQLTTTAADLKLRTPLRLWERTPPGLMMTASLGYRGLEGFAGPAPGEGVSFRLTLDYQPRF